MASTVDISQQGVLSLGGLHSDFQKLLVIASRHEGSM